MHRGTGPVCAVEHRFSRHVAGTLVLHGTAPDDLTIRMGSRVYRNDQLVSPAFDERELDIDPWAREETTRESAAAGCGSP